MLLLNGGVNQLHMDTNEMLVSNSEIQTFKHCRRRWYLNYYRGLQKVEVEGPLALGTRVHLALSEYYSPNGTPDMAFFAYNASVAEDIEKSLDYEKFEKEAKLGRVMLEGYFEWVAETGCDSGLEIIEAESEIEYRFFIWETWVTLLAKRDLIGIDHNHGERRFFMDHKTCQSLENPLLDLDEQVLTYAMIEKMVHPERPVNFAFWNMLRKVLRTARANPPFYNREQLEISETMLRHHWNKTVGVIGDIIEVRQRLDNKVDHRQACYPSVSSRCNWGCQFRQVCGMFDDDSYPEEFITNLYVKSEPYSRYERKGELVP